jgi:hypothetical protein
MCMRVCVFVYMHVLWCYDSFASSQDQNSWIYAYFVSKCVTYMCMCMRLCVCVYACIMMRWFFSIDFNSKFLKFCLFLEQMCYIYAHTCMCMMRWFFSIDPSPNSWNFAYFVDKWVLYTRMYVCVFVYMHALWCDSFPVTLAPNSWIFAFCFWVKESVIHACTYVCLWVHMYDDVCCFLSTIH